MTTPYDNEPKTGPPKFRLLTYEETAQRLRAGRTSFYRAMKSGSPRLPGPVQGPSGKFWIESEIDAYIEALMAQRDALAANPSS
jgi:predicted DNA-binding transcriptional regulator AlpA